MSSKSSAGCHLRDSLNILKGSDALIMGNLKMAL